MIDLNNDLNFIILLTEFRFSNLRITVSTIKSSFNNAKLLCMVPKDSKEEDIKTAKTICPVFKGNDTISSLINIGMKKSERPWNLVVMAGNIIRHNPILKYKRFLTSKKDIMYRVVDKGYWKWEDASIHGVLLHKDTLKDIGDLPESESLQSCKLLWGGKAIEKGYAFKGLVGVRLF